PRVVWQGIDTLARQELGGVLDGRARKAVDDTGLAGVLLADEPQQLPARVVLLRDAVADVGTIEAGDECPRLAQPQPLDHFLARCKIRSRSERNARHAAIALRQHGKLQILRPEVVPPLRDAMRLVDGEERERALIEKGQAALRQQPLRRDIEQLELPGARLPLR